jgi:uncharacterized protein DUF6152
MNPVMKIIAALIVLAGSATATKMVAAHHAMVMYDRTTTVTLNGTVVELQWTNPHVFLLVNGRSMVNNPEIRSLRSGGSKPAARQT